MQQEPTNTTSHQNAQQQREENLKVKRIKKFIKLGELINQIDCGSRFNRDPSEKALEAQDLLEDLKDLCVNNGGEQ